MARLPQELAVSVRPFFESVGVKDALGLSAVEPDGQGVALTVPYFEPERLSPRVLHGLRLVTAHLGTALRLRRRTFGPPSPHDERTEAVLDPAGRVLHATGPAREHPARESLARAVRTIEQARGRLRETSADRALALWDALVSGRWSVIDHTEADGRRVMLIRRNEPGARDPKALAPGERDVVAFAALGHSNKHIAYLLGLSPTTVATHLAGALAKLGLRSRRELIAFLGPGIAQADPPA
jgi:DNA-binding CsgD family transcriptional regulator